MANQRVSYVFGVKKLKPWRKPGGERSLREMLESPEPVPKRHQPTVVNQPINGIVRELFRWQRIHENSILNPDAMAKESDLYPALPVDHSPPLPRAHPVPYPCHRWSQLPAYFMFHIFRIGRALLDYNLPQRFAPEEDILAGIVPSQTNSPYLIKWPGPSRPDSGECREPESPPGERKGCRTLLRRPLGKQASLEIPHIDFGSESHMVLCTMDMGVYMNLSLTTLENSPENPFEAAAFYTENYPLILRRIPCKTEPTRREGISTAYLYKLMEPRQMSLNVFTAGNLSTPSVSSLNQLSSHSPSSVMHLMNYTLTAPSTKSSDTDTVL